MPTATQTALIIMPFTPMASTDSLGRVDVSRLNFVRSGKLVLAKRGMMCSYSTQMTSDKEQGLARRTLRAAFG